MRKTKIGPEAHGPSLAGDAAIVCLKGDLTVDHAVEVKQSFVDAMGKAARVSLVFQDITSADLSVLQLICAAHRLAVAANQTMTLDLDGAGAVVAVATDAGYLRRQGCMKQLGQGCLWEKGER